METFSLNKLSTNSQNFIFSFNGTSETRSNCFSLALASVLVSNIKINKDKADCYFDVEYRVQLTECLNKLTGTLRFNVDLILDFSEKIFNYKYRNMDKGCFGKAIISNDNIVADFFGITYFFSHEDLELIKDNGHKIASYIVKLEVLFKDLGLNKVEG